MINIILSVLGFFVIVDFSPQSLDWSLYGQTMSFLHIIFFSTTSSSTFICTTQHWCIILWSYEQHVLELSQQHASHFLSNFNQKYQEGGGGSGWGGIDSFLTAVLLVTAVFTVLRVITPPRVIHTAPIRAPELRAETRPLLVLHRLHTWNTISRSLHTHTPVYMTALKSLRFQIYQCILTNTRPKKCASSPAGLYLTGAIKLFVTESNISKCRA